MLKQEHDPRIENEVAMSVLRQLADRYSRWMDGVAATLVVLLGWLRTSRRVRLVEQPDGTFSLQGPPGGLSPPVSVEIENGIATCPGDAAAALKGSRVELAMLPDRFFFRSLELPQRASAFLEGIIRAQIDRITPWNANDAAFGWSEPAEDSGDRISITIAAAASAQIMPLAQALARLGAKSIVVTVVSPDNAANISIKALEHLAAGASGARRVRQGLAFGILSLAIFAGLAIASDAVVGNNLRNSQDEVSRRIAERRGIIRAGSDAAGNSALAKLSRLKNQTPASVIALEALSKVLPDLTYVTELRIEAGKLQIVGISNDAPSLIRLIEQSPHFSRATFFAPTTRSPSDPGDRYHIEAQIKPIFLPPS
jgi:general secretion pathway protein L